MPRTPLFNFDSNKKIKLVPEVIQLIPELAKCSEDELRYIILAYDYVNSPFSMKPEDERRFMAKRVVYGDKNISPERTKKVTDAIESYKSLLYDSKRETVEKFKLRVKTLNDLMLVESDYKEIKNLDSSIEILQSRIDKFEEEIFKEEESVRLKGGKKLSLLERLKRNKKLYEIRDQAR